MELFRTTVDWVVVGAGFISWVVFLPQIQLLLRVKRSDSVSLGLLWGSVALQSLALLQLVLRENWQLSVMYVVGLFCLAIIIFLVYRYRKYPGGK